MPSVKQKLYIRIFAAYVILIYLSLPFFPYVVEWIKHSFGSGSIAFITPLLLICIAGVIFTRISNRLPFRIMASKMIVPAVAGGFILLYLKDNPVEQIHLVEYGMLGYLGYKASDFSRDRSRWPSLIWWIAAVVAVGFFDELIQHYLPNRVFDWRDVIINGLSGILGLAAGLIISPPFDSISLQRYNKD